MPPFPSRPVPPDGDIRVPLGPPPIAPRPPMPPPGAARPPMPGRPMMPGPKLGPADFAALKQLRDDILAARPGPDGSLTVRIPPQHTQALLGFMRHLAQAPGGPGAGGPPAMPPRPMGGPPMPMARPGPGPAVLAGLLNRGGPPGGAPPPPAPPSKGDVEGGEGG